MKKISWLFMIPISFLIFAQIAEADVAPSPSSLTIPRGLPATKVITYRITSQGCTSASSNIGQFMSGQHVLGAVNTPLFTNLTGAVTTTGTVSETLTVPIRVLKRAEELGMSRFEFRRQFDLFDPLPCAVFNSSVQIVVSSEAGAEFGITRLQIYFENRRAEITVKRNQPPPSAYVDIRFTGSGLLQGYWEVDGRALSYVNRHLVYGRSVTIESPESPPLPTFVTGTHILRFIITNPAGSIPLPEAIYFVTAEEFKERLPIRLLSPKDQSEMDYTPVLFRWEGKDPAITYLIEFLEEGSEKPIFSAYTKRPEYRLPEPILKHLFSPGRTYLWRVRGFDTDNQVVGESLPFKFTFKELASHLPGQIVVAAELSQRGIELIGRISQKYSLGLIETYDIKSLDLKVAIFQTKEDIFRLIDAIVREDGIVLAQPHYTFRILTEPMSDKQSLYRILSLNKLHERHRGKGVLVAVIDTGVDTQHRDLKDRILSSENLIKDHPYQAEIHGTAVAGIIGASINGFGIEGVAPESEILALRACRQVSEIRPEGECYTASISKAMDRAIEKKAKIVNMSFGSVSSDRLVTKLIEEGTRRGLIFVAPVGNEPRQKDFTFPASHPSVVAVAGIDERGNSYPNPEITSKAKVRAPAVNILTTVPGDKHSFLSGTSLSSATVAGILTLAFEKNESFEKGGIPAFKGDVCRWEEELLEILICER